MSTRVHENPVARSLGLHLMLLLVALLYILSAPKPMLSQAPVEVTLADESERAKPTREIVQRSEGREVKEAKKGAYLSDRSRVVDEERSARNAGEFQRPASRDRASPERAPIRVSDFAIHFKPSPPEEYSNQKNWAKEQTGEALQGGQYIKGMKEGEVSALNTKEFVFYSYFERVRKQLDQAWQPLLREYVSRILKGGRKLASNTDYITRTLVTMNSKGEILRIQMLEESGTQDLDRAAVDALNRAGPYSNPPKGLIDGEGQVQIRWDFILKT